MAALNEYDAIVVGGGHNGLVAGAYLAKAGLRTVVLEARDVVGGAAVTEQPFGPAYKVTALSYVVSLLAPALVADLGLARHGYVVHPQGPYFAPQPDGRALQWADDAARRHASISQFSRPDADAAVRWDEWMGRLGRTMGPLLAQTPPHLGSRRVRDLAAQARLAWQLRGLDERAVADVTRLFTTSIADVVETWFEAPAVRGLLAVSGVIGTWSGPRAPGSAYVMLHHHIGDGGGGSTGQWGFPEGGMGAVTQALASAARALGCEVRVSASVARIDVRRGAARGVVLRDGTELRASTVVTATHPKIAFLDHVDRSELPLSFVTDIERWQTRSGTVKVNLVVDRLPVFTAHPEFAPDVHGGTIVLAPSLDYLEDGFQAAALGEPSPHPFADVCIPSVFDRTLAPEGHHVISMFTQWVPHTWATAPMTAELDAYADTVVAEMEAVAPGFTASIVHRQVIGPHQMEHEYGLVGGNIFHGELTPNQLFHLRPAPGYADYRTPIAGLYQASSATHGGGGVTGIPGRNAARQALADRRRAAWRRRRTRT